MHHQNHQIHIRNNLFGFRITAFHREEQEGKMTVKLYWFAIIHGEFFFLFFRFFYCILCCGKFFNKIWPKTKGSNRNHCDSVNLWIIWNCLGEWTNKRTMRPINIQIAIVDLNGRKSQIKQQRISEELQHVLAVHALIVRTSQRNDMRNWFACHRLVHRMAFYLLISFVFLLLQLHWLRGFLFFSLIVQ